MLSLRSECSGWHDISACVDAGLEESFGNSGSHGFLLEASRGAVQRAMDIVKDSRLQIEAEMSKIRSEWIEWEAQQAKGLEICGQKKSE